MWVTPPSFFPDCSPTATVNVQLPPSLILLWTRLYLLHCFLHASTEQIPLYPHFPLLTSAMSISHTCPLSPSHFPEVVLQAPRWSHWGSCVHLYLGYITAHMHKHKRPIQNVKFLSVGINRVVLPLDGCDCIIECLNYVQAIISVVVFLVWTYRLVQITMFNLYFRNQILHE